MHHSHAVVPPGDYDALLVLMLLPRLVFKAELIMDQLRQQVSHAPGEWASAGLAVSSVSETVVAVSRLCLSL